MKRARSASGNWARICRSVCCLALVASVGSSRADTTGHQWFSVPITYKVFAHTSINGFSANTFSTQVLPTVERAFAHWTSNQVSCTRWKTTYGGSFSSPTGLAAISNTDGVNRVIWLSGTNWKYSSTTLGVTVVTWVSGTGQIMDADMELNNNIRWKVGGTSYAWDVESVVTHEAGHFLGLGHTLSPDAVMAASLAEGSLRTSLTDPDIQDVCSVYPSASGTQGSACTSDADCTGGLLCRGAPGGSKICTKSCTNICTYSTCSPGECPSGYTCQTANTGMACLTPVGSSDLCQFCVDGSQCESGLCVTDGRHNWCTVSCQSSNDCGTGYQCAASDTGSNVCEPSNMACPTAQCADASQCPMGYICNSKKMCEASGNPGDRCEISLYCKSCNVCVGTFGEAFCRTCCAGQFAGRYCDACSPVSCGGAATCEALADDYGTATADKVCIPSGGTACEGCVTSNDCWPGLSCVLGRCHDPCNPGALNSCLQGTCAANPSGSPAGLCACPDEVAYAGQSCGVSSTSIKACAQGTVCVGSPSICRAPCNPTYAGSCPAGQTCQSVSGQNVCVPSNVSGTVCNACGSNGSCGSGLTCSGGRCYRVCDPQNASCDGCTDVGSGGVCACDDEVHGPGGFCGVQEGRPFVCAPGSLCVGEVCRLQCPTKSCPGGQSCIQYEADLLCIPPGVELPPLADGGNGSGSDQPSPSGCACKSVGADGPLALAFLLALLLFARPRAKRKSL